MILEQEPLSPSQSSVLAGEVTADATRQVLCEGLAAWGAAHRRLAAVHQGHVVEKTKSPFGSASLLQRETLATALALDRALVYAA